MPYHSEQCSRVKKYTNIMNTKLQFALAADNTPVIKLHLSSTTDDLRDDVAHRFIADFGYDSNLCTIRSTNHNSNTYTIVPIATAADIPEDMALAGLISLSKIKLALEKYFSTSSIAPRTDPIAIAEILAHVGEPGANILVGEDLSPAYLDEWGLLTLQQKYEKRGAGDDIRNYWPTYGEIEAYKKGISTTTKKAK